MTFQPSLSLNHIQKRSQVPFSGKALVPLTLLAFGGVAPRLSYAQPPTPLPHSIITVVPTDVKPDEGQTFNLPNDYATTAGVAFSGNGKVRAENGDYTATAKLYITHTDTGRIAAQAIDDIRSVTRGVELQFPLSDSGQFTVGGYIVTYELSAILTGAGVITMTDPPVKENHNFTVAGVVIAPPVGGGGGPRGG